MIKKLKKNRVIILTTHGMDEADALADRIAVLSEGKLQCLGTSLYLKHNFGDGYRLSIMTDVENSDKVKSIIRQLMPGSSVFSDQGGSLIISIPVKNHTEIQNFFRIIEAEEEDENSLNFEELNEVRELKKYVHNFSLSLSTLEEVFMKITKKNERFFS